MEEARREKEVWEIVNRERKKRIRVNEGISMKEWKVHFMRLLGGKSSEGKRSKGWKVEVEER